MEAAGRPFYLSIPLPLRLAAAGALWVVAYQALPSLADGFSYGVLGLDPASHLGSAVGFFFYDVPKILLLLVGVVFIVGISGPSSPPNARRTLGGKREGLGCVLASGLGAVTPFCSCSAVPLFVGFVQAGVPLGVTLGNSRLARGGAGLISVFSTPQCDYAPKFLR